MSNVAACRTHFVIDYDNMIAVDVVAAIAQGVAAAPRAPSARLVLPSGPWINTWHLILIGIDECHVFICRQRIDSVTRFNGLDFILFFLRASDGAPYFSAVMVIRLISPSFNQSTFNHHINGLAMMPCGLRGIFTTTCITFAIPWKWNQSTDGRILVMISFSSSDWAKGTSIIFLCLCLCSSIRLWLWCGMYEHKKK